MAKEIQAAHTQTSRNLYALVRDTTAGVWDTTTSAFVSYATADLSNYDIALSELGTASRLYAGDLPALAAGVYHLTVYERLGGSPAEGDPLVAMGAIHWTGSAVANYAAALDAAAIRAALGLASANLDTQLTTIDDFLDTEVAAIKAKTDNLPGDPADAATIASSFSTVNTTLATIAAYLDTEIAAILADTNELQSDLANGGRIDNLIDAVKAKTDNLPSDPATETTLASLDSLIDAVKTKTDLIPAAPAEVGSAMTLTSGERDSIAAALLDLANGIETSTTLRQAVRLVLSACAAKLSGAATTTIAIRDVNDTKNRITATVDADGNRTAVTLDSN